MNLYLERFTALLCSSSALSSEINRTKLRKSTKIQRNGMKRVASQNLMKKEKTSQKSDEKRKKTKRVGKVN